MDAPFFQYDRSEQRRMIEALIFAADQPVTLSMLVKFVTGLHTDNGQLSLAAKEVEALVEELIAEINQELAETHRPYRILSIAGGYQFATIPELGKIVHPYLQQGSVRRLSRAALEALAIIAYRQPVSKPEIDAIRGVRSDEVLQTLLQRELITIVGRAETIGRPLLYGTTSLFLKTFGLKSLDELPKLRELEELLQESDDSQLVVTVPTAERLKAALQESSSTPPSGGVPGSESQINDSQVQSESKSKG